MVSKKRKGELPVLKLVPPSPPFNRPDLAFQSIRKSPVWPGGLHCRPIGINTPNFWARANFQNTHIEKKTEMCVCVFGFSWKIGTFQGRRWQTFWKMIQKKIRGWNKPPPLLRENFHFQVGGFYYSIQCTRIYRPFLLGNYWGIFPSKFVLEKINIPTWELLGKIISFLKIY